MDGFVTLLGQFFAIAIIQFIMEVFIDKEEYPHQVRIVNVACFLGSLYLLLDFVFNNFMSNLSTMMTLPYF